MLYINKCCSLKQTLSHSFLLAVSSQTWDHLSVTLDLVPPGLHGEPIPFANLARKHTHFSCVGILSFQWI